MTNQRARIVPIDSAIFAIVLKVVQVCLPDKPRSDCSGRSGCSEPLAAVMSTRFFGRCMETHKCADSFVRPVAPILAIIDPERTPYASFTHDG